MSDKTCRLCGGKSLSWFTHNKVNPNISQGRLNSIDVECIFVLGCDDCSETIRVVPADEIARLINASSLHGL